ncbi:class I SAM-dependent methyltransferase [Methanoplanus endosymbiosus]|uniref:Class I SAM-dependent methyltransferase n=1 Tax=Methanoplanus endosymbiosus TaxID=33865 RepID=A0A9E7PME7_9EURY|nr:class I SAM-dependent methyltransferase [Methanoplanus endosymbiosus]UUX91326.1 class I SAM-dependent methyltransferase [Methanoplanus endosymbiosus]
MSEEVWENVWNREHIRSDYSLKYIDFIKEFESSLPEKLNIIEVGCGTGQTLEVFSDNNVTTGIDISKNALKQSKGRCNSQILGDMFYIPFKDCSFDLVYNSGVIEHFPDPQNSAAVREMGRITKKGGYVMIIVPNSYCIWYRAWKSLAYRVQKFEFGYEEDYSVKRLTSLIKDSCDDLEIERIFGLQALFPLATNKSEILPENFRKKLGRIEDFLPKKEYYGYAVGVIARKN